MKYGLSNTEAIEAIKKNYPPENYSVLREALDMAIEALETIAKGYVQDGFMPIGYHDKVYAELQKRYFDLLERTRWIPVSDRLPEASDSDGHGKVLVHFSNGYIDIWHWEIVQTNFVSDWLPVLTHWMPLLEPPEQEV